MINETEKLLTQNEVAEMLGISSRTIYRLRLAGKIPYVPVSERRIKYRRDDILQYIADHVTRES